MPKKIVKKERRRSQRINLDLTPKFRLDKKLPFEKVVSCKEVSGGGTRILVKKNLQEDQKIEILFMPDNKKVICADCRVVWSRILKDKKCLAGIEFLEIKEKEAFVQFLGDNLLELSLGSF